MTIDHRHYAPRRAVVSENVMTVTVHSGDQLSVFQKSSAHVPEKTVALYVATPLHSKKAAHALQEAHSGHVQLPSSPLLTPDVSSSAGTE